MNCCGVSDLTSTVHAIDLVYIELNLSEGGKYFVHFITNLDSGVYNSVPLRRV